MLLMQLSRPVPERDPTPAPCSSRLPRMMKHERSGIEGRNRESFRKSLVNPGDQDEMLRTYAWMTSSLFKIFYLSIDSLTSSRGCQRTTKR